MTDSTTTPQAQDAYEAATDAASKLVRSLLDQSKSFNDEGDEYGSAIYWPVDHEFTIHTDVGDFVVTVTDGPEEGTVW